MARPAIIAIDGPVAAGKTAVGRQLSEHLRYRFLDTGIMYRALTWLALDLGIHVEDQESLVRLASRAVIRLIDQEEGTVLIDGRKVSTELREPQVDRTVSLVAKVDGVRSAMVEQQRQIAKNGRIVVVGRDVGTVVLPDADLKLFLVASVHERARRRYLELERQGHVVDYDEVRRDLEARDELDTQRSNSPLRPAPDAHLMDTDGIDAEEVTNKVLELMGRS